MKWAVSTFANAFDAEPVGTTVGWEVFSDRLTHFDVLGSEDKRLIPAWSAARYPPGATRGRKNVVEVSMLVLDVDDGTSPWTVAEAFPWRLLWHTSWSHTPGHPKFRMVVPLARSVPAELWGRVFAWAQERAGGHLDEATKDPSRLWFRPAVRSEDWPREAGIFDHRRELLEIDAEALPEPETERQAAVKALPRRPRKVPADAAEWERKRERQRLLNGDGAARARAADALGAKVMGGGLRQRATSITCPGCGRSSVWFWILPDKAVKAECDHRNTCGWRGWLDDLLGAHGYE